MRRRTELMFQVETVSFTEGILLRAALLGYDSFSSEGSRAGREDRRPGCPDRAGPVASRRRRFCGKPGPHSRTML
jgi:hypothetical protein